MKDLRRVFLSPEATVREAWMAISRGGVGIALLVDNNCHLIGTITDGDIRRAILDGANFDVPVTTLLKYHQGARWEPTVASVGIGRSELIRLMREKSIRHIPLLDSSGRVVDLVTLDELLPDQILPVRAVIMAGGLGNRLRPLTEELPKPMLSVGGQPLMERIVELLRQAGIQQVCITTHYKSEKIASHFGNGSNFGVELDYVNEEQPLGTAGALGLMKKPDKPLLVINGDVLTQVDFRAMLAYHQEHKADLTVAVRKYDFDVPYGVVESDGAFVQELVEKPSLTFFINAGIYLLEPSVCNYLPYGQRCDMPDLIQRLLEEKCPVASFPIVEYWLDIGHPADYNQVQEDVERGKI
jgi:dTDP-glucose pyrophosphorylase/CBS domain-containing protein